jgi:hypothetical protein
MKTIEHTLLQVGCGLGVMLLATSLCMGAERAGSSRQGSPAKASANSTAKKKATARQAKQERVEVTGSSIKYPVKAGRETPATGLSVTVIDPKSAVNRGYSSPLEVLMRTPSVYRGR